MVKQEDHKSSFYKKLDSIVGKKGQDEKFLISDQLYDEIILSVKSNEQQQQDQTQQPPLSGQLKLWAKDGFRLKLEGSSEHLETIGGKMVPKYSQLFDIISAVHQTAGHDDKDKTFKKIYKKFGYIKKEVVQLFMNTCPGCLAYKKILEMQELETPRFTTIIQFGVVDMSSRGDKQYKYMLHVIDFYSQFSWVRHMATNSMEDTVHALIDIVAKFGPPLVLQSDKNLEYTSEVLSNMVRWWPLLRGVVPIGHDPKRHLYLKEANTNLLARLDEWQSRHPDESWTKGVYRVIHRMNWCVSPVHGKAAFEMVYPQHAHNMRRMLDSDDDDAPEVFINPAELLSRGHHHHSHDHQCCEGHEPEPPMHREHHHHHAHDHQCCQPHDPEPPMRRGGRRDAARKGKAATTPAQSTSAVPAEDVQSKEEASGVSSKPDNSAQ